MNFKKDYYEILGVARNSSADEIKSAYRTLAKKYHPDLNPGNIEYEELIKEVNEAYEVLGNSDNRFVYDNYKESEACQEPETTATADEKRTSNQNAQNKRSYTKKVIITDEEKIYVTGDIYIKYRGIQNNYETADILKEIVYNIKITDVSAIISSEHIYKESNKPKEFDKAFSGTKLDLKIRQPIRCSVVTPHGTNFYELNIYDLTIPNVSIKDVTKDDGDSYGTLKGVFYGYIKHVTSHEEETVVTECFGETGRSEQKVENNIEYKRVEYFKNDCTVYWGNWIKVTVETKSPFYQKTGSHTYQNARSHSNQKTGSYTYQKTKFSNSQPGCFSSGIGILIMIFGICFFLFSIPTLSFVLLFFLIIVLFEVLPASLWDWLFRILGIFLLVFFVFSLIGAFNHKNAIVPVAKEKPAELSPQKTPIKNTNSDTLISHFRSWKDYDGKTYEGKFSTRKSLFTNSKNFKSNFNINSNSEQGYDELLYNLGENDKDHLGGLYGLLDTLKIKNKLNAAKFAEMTVSMIQDIPYSVVLPKACDPNLYSDKFISKYLSSDNARCDGYEKFGINTPVEFLTTLYGDCDTRTLLLYTIFKHYDYDVALLSSEYYNHSIIGINLPYEGTAYEFQNKRYILWETTTLSKPGMLPNEISNIDYWRISLKSKK